MDKSDEDKEDEGNITVIVQDKKVHKLWDSQEVYSTHI